jgi:phosphopantothenoylcysteine decarboxylase/phosphopantothenate--cysteine ligase
MRRADMVNFLVTAGPTREHLDDVRFLTNASSGRMGYAIAAEAVRRGHRCVLVAGPTELPDPPGVEVLRVTSGLEMLTACQGRVAAADVVVAAAAVADHRPRQRAPGKPSKGGAVALELVPNPDVIAALAAGKGRRVHVGFALEAAGVAPAEATARARAKLAAKQLDLIVLNDAGALAATRSRATLLFADGSEQPLPEADKAATAAAVLDAALALWSERNPPARRARRAATGRAPTTGKNSEASRAETRKSR